MAKWKDKFQAINFIQAHATCQFDGKFLRITGANSLKILSAVDYLVNFNGYRVQFVDKL